MSQPYCPIALPNGTGLQGSGPHKGPAVACHVELLGSFPGTKLEIRAKGLSLELDCLDWIFNLCPRIDKKIVKFPGIIWVCCESKIRLAAGAQELLLEEKKNEGF